MSGQAPEAERGAHRAVGRYVVEFSRLIAFMRVGMERHLAVDGDRMAPALALGAASADQITNSFFSICEYVGEFNAEEKKVAGRLRKETLDEIKRRNDFAHGDWLVEGIETELEHPVLSRVKPGRRSGPVEKKELPVAEIDAASDEVYALRQKVAEFSAICFDTHPFALGKDGRFQVRHAFRMEGNEVKRISPVAVTWF